jgi:hypothetical protein
MARLPRMALAGGYGKKDRSTAIAGNARAKANGYSGVFAPVTVIYIIDTIFGSLIFIMTETFYIQEPLRKN